MTLFECGPLGEAVVKSGLADRVLDQQPSCHDKVQCHNKLSMPLKGTLEHSN